MVEEKKKMEPKEECKNTGVTSTQPLLCTSSISTSDDIEHQSTTNRTVPLSSMDGSSMHFNIIAEGTTKEKQIHMSSEAEAKVSASASSTSGKKKRLGSQPVSKSPDEGVLRWMHYVLR